MYYSKYVNGLNENNIWFGNILCNPPFSCNDVKLIPRWINKVRTEIISNDRNENIFLILYKPRKDTKWLESLIKDSQRLSSDKLKCTIFKLANVSNFKPYDNGYFYSDIGSFHVFHYSIGKKSYFGNVLNEYMTKVSFETLTLDKENKSEFISKICFFIITTLPYNMTW